jgi:hypothetical protein
VFRSHADQVAAAPARHDAKPLHADKVGPGVSADVFEYPGRPRHMPASRSNVTAQSQIVRPTESIWFVREVAAGAD